MVTRSKRMSTLLAAVAMVVVAPTLLAVPTSPAGASPDDGAAADSAVTPAVVDGAAPAPSAQLVVPGTKQTVPAFQSVQPIAPQALPGSENLPGLAPGSSKVELKEADAPPTRRPGGSSNLILLPSPGYYCDEVIDKSISIDVDDIGQILEVLYYGDVWCNFYLVAASGVAGVIDRTPGYDGQILSVGNTFSCQWCNYGYSQGGMVVFGDLTPQARQIEIAVEAYLVSEIPWGGCGPVPGLRYLACDGLGTNTLHVVLGTGVINTGLQDLPPLKFGNLQGQPGCPMDLTYTKSNRVDTINRREHLADVGFTGTIGCPTSQGFSGTSQAKLFDADNGSLVKEGGQSGANGTSTASTTTFREGEPGGRSVRIVYSGQTVAPPGRTWDGCSSNVDHYLFTQCSSSGNTLNWTAVAVINTVQVQDVIDTGLPPFRDCQVSTVEYNVFIEDGEEKLKATGRAACNSAITQIDVEVAVTAFFNGTTTEVQLPFDGKDEKTVNDGDAVQAQFAFTCDPQNTELVDFQLVVSGTFKHPEGWEQRLPAPLTPPFPLTGQRCMP